jgi:hypothetical protein
MLIEAGFEVVERPDSASIGVRLRREVGAWSPPGSNECRPSRGEHKARTG